ncbi:MurR/RpiR family transcriptional regulator [Shimia marina]|uniref:Putative HTH-type transcriptional regulator YbbH n=1 Tax=Shimia marina TaxID=321267 RepID=A0A0P1FDV4_9RHOB|nr:MurR/RpiR family transcriptional regulator [Shimia marina]CUH52113.1 putative HTH-type transcriptional regulator YbbH [Shimia marina]SFE64273.1 transcriptional regulator, RpiR family [Shimia marina]
MQNPAAPQNVEMFHQRLRDVSDSLPKRMRQCAEYLSAHSDRIAFCTVAELATAAQVQPSAMMRFCQVMGFRGYTEMQKLFKDSVSTGFPDYESRLSALRESGAGSPSALLAEFVDAGRLSLENLTNTIDARSLDAAVNQLSKANMIHVVGLRRAFPVASYLVYAFEKMQIPAMLHDGTGKLNHQHAIRPGDALIAITFAPYSEDTVSLATHCAQQNIPVVAITDTLISPIQLQGVLPLCVSEVDFGAFRSLSATLSLAITLAVSIGAEKNT